MREGEQTLNNFEEGMVCPTHGGYELWQKVWLMEHNRPIEVRIVGINIKGFNRCGWMNFGNKKEIIIDYKVSRTIGYFDQSSGEEIDSAKLFPTKQSLLESRM